MSSRTPRRKGLVPLAAAGAAAWLLLQTAAPTFAGRPAATAGRDAAATQRKAGEQRVAYIAVVDVDVAEGSEEAFKAASLANAKQSVREELNQRFDVLQSMDDPNRWALVEIYRNQNGPVAHKETKHYLTWRDEVAPMMASPRSATQWDTIFPFKATEYAPNALILQRALPDYFNITHVFVEVKPGMEEDFIKETLANAKGSVRESECLRFDFMQSVEEPNKFLLVEVYKTDYGAAAHKFTPHYKLWRENVADMMAVPREAKKYKNHFPNLVSGWSVDASSLQGMDF